MLQATPNVIVASAADPEFPITLSSIDAIKMLRSVYEFYTNVKPPHHVCRGMIHGQEAPVSASNLLEFQQANKLLQLHARMMGKTRSALRESGNQALPMHTR